MDRNFSNESHDINSRWQSSQHEQWKGKICETASPWLSIFTIPLHPETGFLEQLDE